jgi:hypothetical protein
MIVFSFYIILFCIFLPITPSEKENSKILGINIKFLKDDNFTGKQCHHPTIIDVYHKLKPVVKFYLYEDKSYSNSKKKKFIILISSGSVDTKDNEIKTKASQDKENCKGWDLKINNLINPSLVEEVECKEDYERYFPKNALHFGNLYNVYFDFVINKNKGCNDIFLVFKNYHYTICIDQKIQSICYTK